MSALNKELENIARGLDTDPWCPNMEPCDQGRQDEPDELLSQLLDECDKYGGIDLLPDETEAEKQKWWEQQNQDDDYIQTTCADMELL